MRASNNEKNPSHLYDENRSKISTGKKRKSHQHQKWNVTHLNDSNKRIRRQENKEKLSVVKFYFKGELL